MAFEPEPVKTPETIGDIVITLRDHVDPAQQTAHYEVCVVFSDGTGVYKMGNLVPHLTPAQINQIQAFLAEMRDLAQDLLP